MNTAALTVRRARVPIALLSPAFAAPPDPGEPAVLCDVALAAGKILSVSAAAAGSSVPGEFDAAGRLVFPAFVEAHTHLDKAHTWCRAPNRTGTFLDALTTLARDKPRQTLDDLHLRADFALRSAWAHGTRVLRTHVDSDLATAEMRHAAMAGLRTAWAGRIALQTVSLCHGADYATPAGEKVSDLAVRHGASALGGFLQMSSELPHQLDRLLAIARERRSNLYLQDRRPSGSEARAPQWRGLAPVLDLLAAGVPVACASDNVRDAFYPYGDLDALDVYTQSVRLAHLDADLAGSVRVVTSTAADLLGRPEFGRVTTGAPAHLVVFEARSFSELLSRPGTARFCIDGGEIHSPVAPGYDELRAAGLMTYPPTS